MPQGRLAIFRINYKSDFIITLNSDAGWMTPFCIKFWTGAPSQAYFAGWDGTTYTNCAPVDGDPTKLKVQFDDHHLPIGELMYQIGYHFTVADFPTTVEDEVLNQERVVISHDGQDEKVLLDFNGETAPEIEFSLPAYSNESQRIANEEQRIAHEAIRIVNEESRIAAETIRQQNEEQRIQHEEYRVSEFARLKSESEAATTASNDAASLANEKAALAANKAALAQAAATLANEKAQLAADKAALAAAAATLANDKAALAQQKAAYAQEQGDYAKAQGDYAKEQGDTAQADHERAEADHTTAADDHQTAAADHTTAASDHSRAEADHTTAASDHSRAEGDHATAAADHTTAASDHTRAESDHTTAAADHETAASDHTRAESDHAAVEVYVDSLGAFDISAYNATGGVLAKYADLTAALGTDGANIPEAIRKGGMSVKFVQSSDNNYVQFRYMPDDATTVATFINPANWQGVDEELAVGSKNLVESGGVHKELYLYSKDKEVSISGTPRIKYFDIPLSKDKKWFIEINVSNLPNADIDRFTYIRLTTEESTTSIVQSHTVSVEEKTALKNEGKITVEFSPSQNTQYVSLVFSDSALTSGNTITVASYTYKEKYGTKVGLDVLKNSVDNADSNRINILFFGNSLTEDAVQYVPWMLKKIAPELRFKIVNWYKAGASLSTQLSILNNGGSPDRLSLSTNDAPKWVEASSDWPSIISDIQHITIQEHTSREETFDSVSYAGVINKLKDICGKDVKFHHLLEKAVTGNEAKAIHAEEYAKEAWNKMPVCTVVNPGTAFDYAYKDSVLNTVITSDSTYTDTTHAEEGLPCYIEALLVTQWVFKLLGRHFSIQDERLILDATEYAKIGVKGGNVGENGPIYGTASDQLRAQFIAQIAFNRRHDIEQGYDTEKLLEKKVDKEIGKTLISSDVAESLKYVINPDYIEVETDIAGKILGGRKTDGTLFNNTPYENPLKRTDYIESNEWLDAVIDLEGKIIEGITKDGKKRISDFDGATKIALSKATNIQIKELNADFVSPLPVVITGDKGNPNAKYEFAVSLDKKAFNIRFKFRITENLLNQNKSAVIAKLGNSTVLSATSVPLSQATSMATYESQSKTNYWPCLDGGIRLIGSLAKHRNNIGNIAFNVKYTGDSSATIENTGESLIVKIGSTTNTFSYSTYPTVSELYEAIKVLQDISVDYRELNNRNCAELAIFPECNLRPTMYTGITGQAGAPIVEYVDAAEFMIPYAVDESWHNVEIVKIDGTIYVVCDGDSTTIVVSELNDIVLTLGGECGVLFKDLTICPSSVSDAECVDGIVISSYNPYLIVYEGHGIDKVPSVEASGSTNMNTTIDRLEYIFTLMKSKGYIPISVKDIAEWYNGNKDLPKRCYTLIFDDFRFDNVMDIDNRSVFTRFDVKPALAIISDRFQTEDIYHNGVVISEDKAVEIAHMYDFSLVSHTKDHRANDAVKPSEMLSKLTDDVYSAEICGVNGEYLVFPYGRNNPYFFWAMQWLGYYIGVGVWNNSFAERDTYSRSKYFLVRYEIGMRESLSNVISGIK